MTPLVTAATQPRRPLPNFTGGYYGGEISTRGEHVTPSMTGTTWPGGLRTEMTDEQTKTDRPRCCVKSSAGEGGYSKLTHLYSHSSKGC